VDTTEARRQSSPFRKIQNIIKYKAAAAGPRGANRSLVGGMGDDSDGG
jgi:hypothetical protein